VLLLYFILLEYLCVVFPSAQFTYTHAHKPFVSDENYMWKTAWC